MLIGNLQNTKFKKKASRKVSEKDNKLIGLILMLSQLFCFLFSLTPIGFNFFVGTFGWIIYPIFVVLALVGLGIFKGFKYKNSKRLIAFIALGVFCLISIIQLAVTQDKVLTSFADYMSGTFNGVTPGGVVTGLIVWAFGNAFSIMGTYVVYIIALSIFAALAAECIYGKQQGKKLLDTPVSSGIHTQAEIEIKDNKVAETENAMGANPDNIFGWDSDEVKRVDAQNLTLTEEELGIKLDGITETVKESSAAREVKTLMGINPESRERVYKTEGEAELRRYLESGEWETQKTHNKYKPEIEVNPFTAKPNTEAPIINQTNYKRPEKVVFDEPKNDSEPIYERRRRANFDELSPDAAAGIISDSNRAPLENPQIKDEQVIVDNSGEIQEETTHFVTSEPVEVIEEPVKETAFEETAPAPVQTNFDKLKEEEKEVENQIDDIIEQIKHESPEIVAKQENFDNYFTRPVEAETEIEEKAEYGHITEEPVEAVMEEDELDIPAAESENTEESDFVKNIKSKLFIDRKPEPEQTNLFDRIEEKKLPPKFYEDDGEDYVKPPIELLNILEVEEEEDDEWFKEKADMLEQTLGSFNVPVEVINIEKGPAVTRYEVRIQAGISVKKILQYENDIAMMLESNGAIRIEAPVPGKSVVGIEIPNKKITPVSIREIVDSNEFTESRPMAFALGKDITGKRVVCDIADAPHMLIAGSTGSGKSVCLSTMLVSLLYKLSPKDLKIILIDPKKVEFPVFNGLPHLIMPSAITEVKDAINALGWTINEMNRRLDLFKEVGVNQIKYYNARREVMSGMEPKLPMILIVIDELANLMQLGKRDVEDRIAQITALARATGIHLVVATQRPSVDVVTGLIKNNIPTRIAFKVPGMMDSRTIIDQMGAESLLGKGDMLYVASGDPKRLQCAYVSPKEVEAVVEYIKENNKAYFDEKLASDILKKEEEKPKMEVQATEGDDDGEDKIKVDSLFLKALKFAIERGEISTSVIQRKYGVGFNRAGRMIDIMESNGMIAPNTGSSKPRSVYITMEEYNKIFGEQ